MEAEEIKKLKDVIAILRDALINIPCSCGEFSVFYGYHHKSCSEAIAQKTLKETYCENPNSL